MNSEDFYAWEESHHCLNVEIWELLLAIIDLETENIEGPSLKRKLETFFLEESRGVRHNQAFYLVEEHLSEVKKGAACAGTKVRNVITLSNLSSPFSKISQKLKWKNHLSRVIAVLWFQIFN